MSAGPWQALARPEAFPHDASAGAGVEWLQTHLSHVYLTRDRVYKFRKPVDLGFVDFSTRRERNLDCRREVELNRRLAPDVYLGVAALAGTEREPRVTAVEQGAHDPDRSEHCVVMRRLPAGRDALSLLESGRLSEAMLDRLSARLAAFHSLHGLGTPAPFAPEAWLERCTRPVGENFRILARAPREAAPRHLLDLARSRAIGFGTRHADRFERRRSRGRAVDAHGDLHLQHVWYERDDAEPLAIDGLEFSESLRRIDAASEVAFLAMDLRYRGAGPLAERFLARYARDADDFELYSVVDYFAAYRAGVRAKVAALAAQDAGIARSQRRAALVSARRHLELAGDLLEAPGRAGIALVAGAVGTGKSSVAEALARRLDAVVIASDRVRKHLHGVAPTERLSEGWGSGAYAPEQTDRVYAALWERARPVLESGRPVILDATHSRRAHRSGARRLARELGVRVFAVEVRCDPERARERLARRAAAGTDPSDAGPEAVEPSARGFEPLDEWPEADRVAVSTDRESWTAELAEPAARIRVFWERPDRAA